MMHTGLSMNGYYDDNGRWQKTKFCFVSCGVNCDCGAPGGLTYRKDYDKALTPHPKSQTCQCRLCVGPSFTFEQPSVP